MITFTTTILKFGQQGEKTGWTYITVDQKHAAQLLPGQRKSFRVKGKLDHVMVKGLALLPMGNGDFILPLKAAIRKVLGKAAGASIHVSLGVDLEEPTLNESFLQCLHDDPEAFRFFQRLPKGHQRYFSKWIDEAKTDVTQARRIATALQALSRGWGFSEMLRAAKKENTLPNLPRHR